METRFKGGAVRGFGCKICCSLRSLPRLWGSTGGRPAWKLKSTVGENIHFSLIFQNYFWRLNSNICHQSIFVMNNPGKCSLGGRIQMRHFYYFQTLCITAIFMREIKCIAKLLCNQFWLTTAIFRASKPFTIFQNTIFVPNNSNWNWSISWIFQSKLTTFSSVKISKYLNFSQKICPNVHFWRENSNISYVFRT